MFAQYSPYSLPSFEELSPMLSVASFLATNLFEDENTNPKIENVIFNGPATVVFWDDGDKTIVKCQEGDIFDKELGLAMAVTKKYFGNKGNFNDEFKKWVY